MTNEEIIEMWETVEDMTSRMGYDNPDFDWMGPLFKPVHHNLKTYPPGTTCWYVRIKTNGIIYFVTGSSPLEAVRKAASLCIA